MSQRKFLLSWIGFLSLCMAHDSQSQTDRPRLVVANGGMPQWKDAAPYAREHARNILDRSTFFLPVFGVTYKEKFESLVSRMPAGSVRGVVIHNHGCAGQWVLETQVAQFYYQQGFAVVTPEFVSREGNKTGCPGGSEDEMRRLSGERQREGIFQATNPARLAARADEVMAVVQWLRGLTALPIVLSGHSEGCRTVYSIHLNDDAQVAGGVCIKQGLQRTFEHTWRWNSKVPMWQSLEEFDPWVVFPEGTSVRDVTFERKFVADPQNLTVVTVPGKTHFPLNQEAERASLRQWLGSRTSVTHVPGQNGFNYETALPDIQMRLRQKGPR
jgi:dienelactone hydrolase